MVLQREKLKKAQEEGWWEYLRAGTTIKTKKTCCIGTGTRDYERQASSAISPEKRGATRLAFSKVSRAPSL